MNVRILDLTRQYEIIKEKVEKAVCEQMRTGAYIGGKAVTDFEEKFAAYTGAKYAIAVNSGTDALVIAMKALGIGKGDEVITTPFTFFATAETIAMVGATPVFVDVDENTYNMDPSKIEEKITEKTKAILPVHIFGQPVNFDEIKAVASKHDLLVIEDACQAVGSAIGDKMIGSLGDAACFSFFPTKNLGGFGDGGMITTNDEKTATVCRAFREHGGGQNGAKARFYLDGVKDELADAATVDGLYNPYKYYNYLIAYNSRLDAIQARVLDIKLDYLDGFNARRAEIAAFYEKELGVIDKVKTPQVMEGVKPVWHQYAIRVKEKNELGEFLAKKNIGSAAFYPVPLHLQKAFEYLGYKEGDLPVAEQITKETVCLPIFPELTQDELDYIVQGIKEFFD